MVRYVCIHTRRALYSFSAQALSGASHEIEFGSAPLYLFWGGTVRMPQTE